MPGTLICYGDSNTYGYDPHDTMKEDIPKRSDGQEYWIQRQTGKSKIMV